MTTFKASFLLSFIAGICLVLAAATTVVKRAPVVDMRGHNLTPAQAAAQAKELTDKSGRMTFVRYK